MAFVSLGPTPEAKFAFHCERAQDTLLQFATMRTIRREQVSVVSADAESRWKTDGWQIVRTTLTAMVAILSVTSVDVAAQPTTQVCVDTKKASIDVLAIDSKRIAALLDNDVETLAALTAENYSHVESSGGARDRAQFLSVRRSGRSHFSTFVIEENAVTIYCNVAVVTGRYYNSVHGSTSIKKARHLRVYVHQDGDWKNVAHQATEMGRSDR